MQYTIQEKESFSVLGIRRIVPYGGGTWAIVKADDAIGEKIREISGHFFNLGLCFGFQPDGSDDYMCAVEWNGDDVEGFDSFTFPPAVWLVFEVRGKISDNVLFSVWNYINEEFLPGSKYEILTATVEDYILWDEENDLCHVEIRIPVKQKTE